MLNRGRPVYARWAVQGRKYASRMYRGIYEESPVAVLGSLVLPGIDGLTAVKRFVARIRAQEKVDVFEQINPIGVVLEEIMKNYVEDPDIDKVVEGALTGMMNSLDDHSSYIPPTIYEQIINDTEGEFDGIGVKIQLDEDKNITVFHPMAGSPAAKAGMMGGDMLLKIDDISTKGMKLDQAAKLIRGPRGTIVHLKVLRRSDDENTPPQFLDMDVPRDKIPLEKHLEARVLDGAWVHSRQRLQQIYRTRACRAHRNP